MAVLSLIANSKNPLLNPDTSPLLHLALKKTLYAQFCAGETPAEVRSTITDLKSLGYKGVILNHAKEAVLSKQDIAAISPTTLSAEQEHKNIEDVGMWRNNAIETIDLAQKDDFVALKFTGAGQQALQHLQKSLPCAPAFEQAIHEICQRAQSRGVSLLIDAEYDALQDGIDSWTMHLAKVYNKGEKAVVYGTYQAYKKKVPEVLAKHLETARRDNFILGVKLVRGAYMGSDPRELFWSTVEETHICYDEMAEAVMKQRYGRILNTVKGGSPDFPRVELCLASHNAESMRRAQELRDEQARTGENRIRLSYGQLYGMADNVSCDLVKTARNRLEAGNANVDIPGAYKYVTWGKMGECMKYLLRRAQENKDAVSRTVDARKALGKELGRRLGLVR